MRPEGQAKDRLPAVDRLSNGSGYQRSPRAIRRAEACALSIPAEAP